MRRHPVLATVTVALVAAAAGLWLWLPDDDGRRQPPAGREPAVTITVDPTRWPNIADHIADAQAAGHPATCTLDRDGAEDNRDESLAGVPTRDGHDRDEYPAAVCHEGGEGASVRHVPSGENRSHGSWLGQTVEGWPDGTVVVIEVG